MSFQQQLDEILKDITEVIEYVMVDGSSQMRLAKQAIKEEVLKLIGEDEEIMLFRDENPQGATNVARNQLRAELRKEVE